MTGVGEVSRALLVETLRQHSYLHVKRCKCGAQVDDVREHQADALLAALKMRPDESAGLGAAGVPL